MKEREQQSGGLGTDGYRWLKTGKSNWNGYGEQDLGKWAGRILV
jgi:hypothetical protein